jgi:hypothetical protein
MSKIETKREEEERVKLEDRMFLLLFHTPLRGESLRAMSTLFEIPHYCFLDPAFLLF